MKHLKTFVNTKNLTTHKMCLVVLGKQRSRFANSRLDPNLLGVSDRIEPKSGLPPFR